MPASGQFIDFKNENVKVVFTQETSGGVTSTIATATVIEQDPVSGAITVRRLTQKQTPDGSGGYTKVVTQETTVATPDSGNPGFYIVVTNTKTTTTTVDDEGNEGVPSETEVGVSDPAVPVADLDLPQSTQFAPVAPDLDDPLVISPL